MRSYQSYVNVAEVLLELGPALADGYCVFQLHYWSYGDCKCTALSYLGRYLHNRYRNLPRYPRSFPIELGFAINSWQGDMRQTESMYWISLRLVVGVARK